MSVKRDFIETERTPGWQEYRTRVEKAIADAEVDLHSIDTEGKTAEQIGVEHLKIAERIAGLKQALGIAEDIKTEAADDI